MEQSATVTNDDGDKVDHGFTVLDIAKHAMCTYVASLDDADYVYVVCYASEARLVIDWTACNAQGKEALFAAIRSLKEEGSTNLTAGLSAGIAAFEQDLPPAVAADPDAYALLLAVATDGQPSSGTHPPGGSMGYADFVRGRLEAISAARGATHVPALVAIGLGNDLDSTLLSSFSDSFLHIPDPGSVGSFMVNLLAATRATALVPVTDMDEMRAKLRALDVRAGLRSLELDEYVDAFTKEGYDDLDFLASLPRVELEEVCSRLQLQPGHAEKLCHALLHGTATGESTPFTTLAAANHATLRLSPASAVTAVPGHTSLIRDGEVLVPLGSVMYDQPRHVFVATAAGAPPLAARVTLGNAALGHANLEIASAEPPSLASAAETGAGSLFAAELERVAATCALDLQERRLSVVDELGAPKDEVARRLAREGGRFGDVTISLLWNDQSDLDLWVITPDGEKVFYGNKKDKSGKIELDVDMNADKDKSKEPVENVYAGDVERGIEAPRGRYKVQVNNFNFHSDEGLPTPRDIPFKVSVRMHDDSTEYPGVCSSAKQTVDVISFEYHGRLEGATEHAEQLQAQTRRAAEEKTRLAGVPSSLLEQAVALLSPGTPLVETLSTEALLAVQPDKFGTWGRHYLATLPAMLRAERRSNFRDAALATFGCGTDGEPAVFEDLSSKAELRFSQLSPPQPSGLERIARQKAHTDARTAEEALAQAARPVHTPAQAVYTTMPDEFMRGGGCFAPDALISCVTDGGFVTLPIASVRAGMAIRTASGGVATVRCVVVSPCSGGEMVLSELNGSLRITEWHPVQVAAGQGARKWRFPNVIGRRVLCRVPAVYNLVLSREHVALVSGVPCATLGHGIRGPVIGHRFWGSSAVIEDLSRREGWASGRVVLSEPLRAQGDQPAIE